MASFDEHSIYNLLTVQEGKQRKPKRYTSKFRQSVKEEYESGRGGNKTMGPTKVLAPLPSKFLKKHEKEPQLLKRECFHYPDEERNKPPIPKIKEKPLMGLKPVRNFICDNAKAMMTSSPKVPSKKFVDTRHGDTYNLVLSGHEPVYIHKKNYGEVPTYLVQRSEEVNVARDQYDQYVAENFKRGALKQLTAEEHETILEGLRANWEDIHDRYRSLSVVIDSSAKKSRRERMEGQMKQLERDIELFEKHKIIYVGN